MLRISLVFYLCLSLVFSPLLPVVAYAQDSDQLHPGEGGAEQVTPVTPKSEPEPTKEPEAPYVAPPKPAQQQPTDQQAFDHYSTDVPAAKVQPADVPQEPAPAAAEEPPAPTPKPPQEEAQSQPLLPQAAPTPSPTLTPTPTPPLLTDQIETERQTLAASTDFASIYGEETTPHATPQEKQLLPTPVPTPPPPERAMVQDFQKQALDNPAVDERTQQTLVENYEHAATVVAQRNDAKLQDARVEGDEQAQGTLHTIVTGAETVENAPLQLAGTIAAGTSTSFQTTAQSITEPIQQFQEGRNQSQLNQATSKLDDQARKAKEQENKAVEEALNAPAQERAKEVAQALGLPQDAPPGQVVGTLNDRVARQAGLKIEGDPDNLIITEEQNPTLASAGVKDFNEFANLSPDQRQKYLEQAQSALTGVAEFTINIPTAGLYDYAKHSGQRSLENKRDLDNLENLREGTGFPPPYGIAPEIANPEAASEMARLGRLTAEQLEEEVRRLREADPINGENLAKQLLKKKAYADALATYDKEQMKRIDEDMKELTIAAALTLVGGKALEVGGKVLSPVTKYVGEKSQGLIGSVKNFVTPVVKRETHEGVLLAENALKNVTTESLATEAKQVLQTKGTKEAQAFIDERLRKEIAQKAPDTLLAASKVELDDAIYRETAKLLDMEVFYHYTSDAGAKGILESGTVRASKGSLTYKGVFVTDLRPDQIQPTRGRSGNAPTNILDAGMQLGNRLGITQQVGVKEDRLTNYFVIYAPKGTFKPTVENRVGFIREWITNNADISLNDPNILMSAPFKNTTLREAPSLGTGVVLSSASVGGLTGGVTAGGVGAEKVIKTLLTNTEPTREELERAMNEVNAELSTAAEKTGVTKLESRLPWKFAVDVSAQEDIRNAAFSVDSQAYEALVKQRIIKNRLLTNGKVDPAFIQNTLKREIVEPKFAKTDNGYIFITGKNGSVEGTIDGDRYLIHVEPLPGIDLKVPKVIDSKHDPITITVSVVQGSGKVESVDYLTKGSIEKGSGAEKNKATVILFSDTNGNGKFDENEETLPLAGIQVVLERVSQDVSVYLLPGWNLITLTALPGKPLTAAVLLAEIARQGGYATTVATLANGSWKTYVVRGDKDFSGEDFVIEPGKAYFLKSLKRSLLLFKGQKFATPVKLSLQSGWNAVGFPKTSRAYKVADVIDALNALGAESDAASRWESGLWDTFVKKQQEKYGANFSIEQNRGYIMRVKKGQEFSP